MHKNAFQKVRFLESQSCFFRAAASEMQRKADCSFQFTGNFLKKKKQLIFLIKHVIIKLDR